MSDKVPPLPLEEAQQRLVALVEPLAIEHVDVAGAVGHHLAQSLLAARTQPAADMSAMDGYAVRADDLSGPWRVIGESAAGHPFAAKIGPGECVRIATGALVPADANCVILQEDVVRTGDKVLLHGTLPARPDRHIRRRGMDFQAGAEILSAGTRIGPAQAALAVAAGHTHLPVRRSARVFVFDSGDELAADPQACAAHQIPASNGIMIAAMIAAMGCEVHRGKPVADELDALKSAFEQAGEADVIVTSGGASVGDHDLIRPALEAAGARLDFWRVAIKPGKPILVATRARAGLPDQIVLGLPGNPVSTHVTAFLFLLPLIRALHGAARIMPVSVKSALAAPLPENGGRRQFLRASWNGESVIVQDNQDSAALASLAASNALIDRPARAPQAAAGETVAIYLLGNGGIA